jgi:hypothetical protein
VDFVTFRDVAGHVVVIGLTIVVALPMCDSET